MLHRLYTIIRRSGRDGAVSVSELTFRMYDFPQAVSRALRILEKDGLIQRTADPEDRRSFTQDLVLFAQAVEEENEARRAGKDD